MVRFLCILLAPLACTTAPASGTPVSPSQTPPARAHPPEESPRTAPPQTEPARTEPPRTDTAQTEPPAKTEAPSDPPASSRSKPGSSGWTDAGGGLSVRLELPARRPRIGDSVKLRLHFRNTGAAPLRIYMIGSEVFRAQQSDLAIFGADDTFIASQPEPHPHGYVVSERDFPQIAPGKEQVHAQTVHLKGPAFTGVTGPLRLSWTYSNKIESWKGGAQTLDGPTKSLFGGGPIPGIWRGEVVVEATLPLAP